MDEKTLTTLEYNKILARLASYCAFGASQELAEALRPSAQIDVAKRGLTETTEARALLEAEAGTTVWGARDVRAAAGAAERGVVLTITDLLGIKSTLVSARTVGRTFEGMEGT